MLALPTAEQWVGTRRYGIGRGASVQLARRHTAVGRGLCTARPQPWGGWSDRTDREMSNRPELTKIFSPGSDDTAPLAPGPLEGDTSLDAAVEYPEWPRAADCEVLPDDEDSQDEYALGEDSDEEGFRAMLESPEATVERPDWPRAADCKTLPEEDDSEEDEYALGEDLDRRVSAPCWNHS